MSIVLRSNNFPARIGDRNTPDELQWLTDGAHALILQEGRHAEDNLAPYSIQNADGHWAVESTLGDPALPMLIHRSLRITGRMSRQAYPDTPVGSWGAGPATLKAAWDVGVLLEGHGVEPFWLIDAHLPPSVSRPAHTKDEKAARDRRRVLHKLEIANLVEMTKDLSRVVIGGDFNCGPGYPGLDPLILFGFRDVQPGPTHGPHERIDHWFVKGFTPKEYTARVMPKGRSDHNPIELVLH